MNKIILILILLLASFLRLWKLDQVPVSLFSDELDVGYQAYSIIKTGRDYSGNFLPLHFASLAEFRTPLYIYASVPTVAVFGITPYGVRLPAAIFGILGVYGIYLLVNELFKGLDEKVKIFHTQFTSHQTLALLSAFFLAISPWHIQYSRASFEVTMMITFLIFGLYFFLKYTKTGKALWLSALLLGLTPWVYSTAKLFIPFFVLVLITIWRKSFAGLKKLELIKTIIVILFLAIPMVFVTLKGQAGNRFSYISVFTDPTLETDADYERLVDSKMRQVYGGGPLSKVASGLIHNKYSIIFSEISGNLLSSFSTDFLFTRGDINLRHSIEGMGQFYRVEFLMLIFGAIVFFSDSQNKNNKYLMLSWLVIAVLPAALTRGGGTHATRSILMLPPLIFLISYGVYFVINDIKKPLNLVLVSGYFVMLIINFILYQHSYWYHNPWHSERSWHAGYKQLVLSVKEIEADYDKIIITNAVEPPWIYFVSYYPFHPEKKPRDLEKEEVFGFGELEKLDKYYFGQVGKIGVKNLAKVLDDKTLYVAAEREVGENLIMDPDKVYKGLTLVKSIAYPSGEPAFYFFKKDDSVEVKSLEMIN
ncbi:hypothetical protein JXA63_01800 [Candidatus Woesebacteria bacterium]|nr:hypothetical protein [Candidatus Woesebacteria bacterium]